MIADPKGRDPRAIYVATSPASGIGTLWASARTGKIRISWKILQRPVRARSGGNPSPAATRSATLSTLMLTGACVGASFDLAARWRGGCAMTRPTAKRRSGLPYEDNAAHLRDELRKLDLLIQRRAGSLDRRRQMPEGRPRPGRVHLA